MPFLRTQVALARSNEYSDRVGKSIMIADRSQFESPEQMADATVAALVGVAAHHAFGLFSDNEFRRLAGFDTLSRAEQDRIFNELLVAYIVLIMLVLEAPDLRVPPEFRGHLVELKKLIPKAHIDSLRALGVEIEHLRVWEKLISLRYDEYAKDRHEVRAAAMQIESTEKPLDFDDLSKIQMLVPVQAVAIGCHHHVCRGDANGRDELFKLTLRSLSRFYVDIRVRLEGGKITFLTRARLAPEANDSTPMDGEKRIVRRLGKTVHLAQLYQIMNALGFT
jgi:hypothetical protein